MNRICKYCKKVFSAWPSYVARNGGQFCSRKCRGLAFRGILVSPNCGFQKGHKQPTGKDSPLWKNARTKNASGYIVRTKNRKLLFEHRIVAEEKLGRALTKGETVHHINRKKDDNRPGNLLVLSSQSEHMKLELKNNNWLHK